LKYFVGLFTYLLFSTSAMAQLEVIISGGFQGPYNAMLPEFQKMTGISVITKSGASQGSGPKTIKAQLANGVTADIVIMSREGLAELMTVGKIAPGTDVDLAQAPLGLAVPAGSPKPDISTTTSFTIFRYSRKVRQERERERDRKTKTRGKEANRRCNKSHHSIKYHHDNQIHQWQ
jgi:molybdate transport system substrate-binding protein